MASTAKPKQVEFKDARSPVAGGNSPNGPGASAFAPEEVNALSDLLLKTPADDLITALLEDADDRATYFPVSVEVLYRADYLRLCCACQTLLSQLFGECQQLVKALVDQRAEFERKANAFSKVQGVKAGASDSDDVKRLRKQLAQLQQQNEMLQREQEQLNMEQEYQETEDIDDNIKSTTSADALGKDDVLVNNIYEALKEKGLSPMAAFRACDVDNNGVVTTTEFRAFLEGLKLPVTKAQLAKLMILVDESGNGKIDQKEFINTFKAYGAPVESDAKAKELQKLAASNASPHGKPGKKAFVVTSGKLGNAYELHNDGFGIGNGGGDSYILSVLAKMNDLLRVRGLSPEKIFRAIDVDDEGSISLSELDIFLGTLKLGLQKKELYAIMKVLDRNNDGSIQLSEFTDYFKSAVANNLIANKNNPICQFIVYLYQKFPSPEQAFKTIDSNQNGVVSFMELKQFCEKSVPDMDRSRTAELMKQLDTNQNGTIEESELMEKYNQVIELLQESDQLPAKQGVNKGSSDPQALQAAFQRIRNVCRQKNMSLEDIRRRYDKDGDGILGVLEFTGFLQSAPVSMPANEIKALVKHIDPDSEGFIQVDDFLGKVKKALSAPISDHNMTPEEKYHLAVLHTKLKQMNLSPVQAFRMCDSDSNGNVTLEELGAAIRGLCAELKTPQIEGVRRALDKNLDGTITAKEFEDVMNAIASQVQDKPLPKSSSKTANAKFAKLKEKDDLMSPMDEAKKESLLAMFREELKKKKLTPAQAFRAADADNSGTVTLAELASALQTLLPLLTKPDVAHIFKALDINDNKTIDFDEFNQAVADAYGSVNLVDSNPLVDKIRKKMKQENLTAEQTFQIVDQDANGVITVTELVNGLLKLLPKITRAEGMDLMKLLDVNKNGTIEHDEFMDFFSGAVPIPKLPPKAAPNTSTGPASNKSVTVIEQCKAKMAAEGMTPQDAFDFADEDGNGVLTVMELSQAMRRLVPDFGTNKIMEVMKILDTNGNGTVERNEFLAAFGADIGKPVTNNKNNNNDTKLNIANTKSTSVSATATATASNKPKGGGDVHGDVVEKCKALLEEEGTTAEDAFDFADEEGHGVLTISQLSAAIRRLIPDFSTNKIMEVMKVLDTNRNGTVERSEFLHIFGSAKSNKKSSSSTGKLASSAANGSAGVSRETATFARVKTKMAASKLEPSQIFDASDMSKDGVLSVSELANGLQRLLVDVSRVELSALFDEVDLDQDGTVTRDEFIAKFGGTKKAPRLMEGTVIKPAKNFAGPSHQVVARPAPEWMENDGDEESSYDGGNARHGSRDNDSPIRGRLNAPARTGTTQRHKEADEEEEEAEEELLVSESDDDMKQSPNRTSRPMNQPVKYNNYEDDDDEEEIEPDDY